MPGTSTAEHRRQSQHRQQHQPVLVLMLVLVLPPRNNPLLAAAMSERGVHSAAFGADTAAAGATNDDGDEQNRTSSNLVSVSVMETRPGCPSCSWCCVALTAFSSAPRLLIAYFRGTLFGGFPTTSVKVASGPSPILR